MNFPIDKLKKGIYVSREHDPDVIIYIEKDEKTGEQRLLKKVTKISRYTPTVHDVLAEDWIEV